MGEEWRGLQSTNRLLQNSHRDIKYSIGNGAAKELIHMTHGHELRGMPKRVEGAGWSGNGGGQRGKVGTTMVA